MTNPNPAAPVGLVLDACTVTADGGKTVSTLSRLAAQVESLANQIATALASVTAAETSAREAQTAASKAQTDAQEAAALAKDTLHRSDVAFPDFDQVAALKNGNLIGATGFFQTPYLGQGYQQSWNDPPGQASTSHVNISPPGTVGGHTFFDIETVQSLDPERWGFRLYSKWGFTQQGLPNASAVHFIGRPNSSNWQSINFYSAAQSFTNNGNITGFNSGDVQIIARGGSGATWDGQLSVRASSVVSDQDGFCDLGTTGNRFNNLFLSGTVNQVSDANEKDFFKNLLSLDDDDRHKLITFYDAIEPVLYKYKAAVASKGDAARIHTGVIAQNVEKAFTDAGLDPAHWSIWSVEPLTEQVQIPHTTTREVTSTDPATDEVITKTVEETTYTYETRPILDAEGKQRNRQALNYLELLMLMTTCARLKQQDFEADLRAQNAAIDARLTALEGRRNAK